MKILSFLFISFILAGFFVIPGSGWLTNFDEAAKIASDNHQLILLNFSGSDWCGPCIRLKKEIFDTKPFMVFAISNLVLINADFPRSKKNRLSEQQVKMNESLADKFNRAGKFPLTLLLTPTGKVIKKWDGFPAAGTEQFVQDIKVLCDANK